MGMIVPDPAAPEFKFHQQDVYKCPAGYSGIDVGADSFVFCGPEGY